MTDTTEILTDQSLTEKEVLQGKINNLMQQHSITRKQLEELMNKRDTLASELAEINRQINELRDYQYQLFNKVSASQNKLNTMFH
ncbi:MAG: hypothetical protein ACXAEU_23735 [Candidatus Hodarchaeales archaeon]|jgi:uncharacterized coiled-coil DUF342 family protein